MKFYSNLGVVLNHLRLASEVVSAKGSGLLSSILIQASKTQTVTVQSNDTKISFRSEFAAEVEQEGKILVFCGRLMSVLGTMSSANIVFESDDEAELLRINPVTGKKLKLELKLLSSDRFPNMPELDEGEYFDLNQKTFLNMIHNTNFAVSTDPNRSFLNGCLLERSEDVLTMVATDAKRLALYSTTESSLPFFEGIIIPPKILHFLDKITTGEGNLKIAVTTKRIYFKVAEFDVSSVLIDGKFPEYTKILPKHAESSLSLNREEFLEAAHRISIMTEKNSKTCVLSIKDDNRLVIMAKGSDVGSAEEEISYEGDTASSIDLVVTSRYLLEPLKILKSEKVFLEYTNISEPIKLRAEGETEFFHIFMALTPQNDSYGQE